jgi:hypothetical protein
VFEQRGCDEERQYLSAWHDEEGLIIILLVVDKIMLVYIFLALGLVSLLLFVLSNKKQAPAQAHQQKQYAA